MKLLNIGKKKTTTTEKNFSSGSNNISNSNNDLLHNSKQQYESQQQQQQYKDNIYSNNSNSNIEIQIEKQQQIQLQLQQLQQQQLQLHQQKLQFQHEVEVEKLKKNSTVIIPKRTVQEQFIDRPRKLSNAFEVELYFKLKQRETDFAQSLSYAVSPFQFLDNENGDNGGSGGSQYGGSDDNGEFKVDLNFDGYSEWYREMMEMVKLKIKSDHSIRKELFDFNLTGSSSNSAIGNSDYYNSSNGSGLNNSSSSISSKLPWKGKKKLKKSPTLTSQPHNQQGISISNSLSNQNLSLNNTNSNNINISPIDDNNIIENKSPVSNINVGAPIVINGENQSHLDFLKRHENKTTVTSPPPSSSTPLSTSQPKTTNSKIMKNLNSSINTLDTSVDYDSIQDNLSNTGSDILINNNNNNINATSTHTNSNGNLLDALLGMEFPHLNTNSNRGELKEKSFDSSLSQLQQQQQQNEDQSNHRNLRRLNSSQTIFHKFQRNSSNSNLLTETLKNSSSNSLTNDDNVQYIRERERLSLEDSGPHHQQQQQQYHHNIRNSYSTENLKSTSQVKKIGEKIGEKILSFFKSNDRIRKSEQSNRDLNNLRDNINNNSMNLTSGNNSNSSGNSSTNSLQSLVLNQNNLGNSGNITFNNVQLQQQQQPSPTTYVNGSTTPPPHRTQSSSSINYSPRTQYNLDIQQQLLQQQQQQQPLNRSQSHISLQSLPPLTPRTVTNLNTPPIKYSPPFLSPNNSFNNLDSFSSNGPPTPKNIDNNKPILSSVNNNNHINNNNIKINEQQLKNVESIRNSILYKDNEKLNNNVFENVNNSNNQQDLHRNNNNNNNNINNLSDDEEDDETSSFSSSPLSSPLSSPDISPSTSPKPQQDGGFTFFKTIHKVNPRVSYKNTEFSK